MLPGFFGYKNGMNFPGCRVTLKNAAGVAVFTTTTLTSKTGYTYTFGASSNWATDTNGVQRYMIILVSALSNLAVARFFVTFVL